MNNVAILGTASNIAKEFYNRDFLCIDVDITNKEELKSVCNNLLRQTRVDTIINCIEYSDVMEAELNPILCNSINVIGVRNLSEVWHKNIVHISNDHVFDGKNGPYKETDIVNPRNTYGFSKYFAEVILRNYLDRTLIVRTSSCLYNDNELLIVPESNALSPTYVPHLVDGIIDAIKLKKNGILNIAGKSKLSYYDQILLLKLNLGVNNVTVDNPKYNENDILYNLALDTSLAESMGIRLYTFTEGLMQYGKRRIK